MKRYIEQYRNKIDGFFRPWVWWSFWGVFALHILYMLLFKAILFYRDNYHFLVKVAIRDMYTGKLFFFIIFTPLVIFTCLLTSYLALAVYRVVKFKKT